MEKRLNEQYELLIEFDKKLNRMLSTSEFDAIIANINQRMLDNFNKLFQSFKTKVDSLIECKVNQSEFEDQIKNKISVS